MYRIFFIYLIAAVSTEAWAESLQVGRITSSSIHQMQARRQALGLWGVSFGPYSSRGLRSEAMLYSLAVTNHREVSEHAEIRTRFGAGVAENGSAQVGSITFGAAYMPFLGDATPLLGGEFGLGYAGGKKVKDSKGFSGALLAGVRLFRTSNTHMEVMARYETIVNKPRPGQQRPHNFGVQLGILF